MYLWELKFVSNSRLSNSVSYGCNHDLFSISRQPLLTELTITNQPTTLQRTLKVSQCVLHDYTMTKLARYERKTTAYGRGWRRINIVLISSYSHIVDENQIINSRQIKSKGEIDAAAVKSHVVRLRVPDSILNDLNGFASSNFFSSTLRILLPLDCAMVLLPKFGNLARNFTTTLNYP